MTSSTASRTYRAMKRSGASGFAELNKEKKEDRRSTDPTIPPSNLSTRVGSVSRKGQRRGLAGAIACHVAASGMLFCRASWLRPTPAAGSHTKPSRGESSNGQIGQGDRGVVPRGWRRLPPDLSDKLLSKARPVLGSFLPGRCNLFARTEHVSQGLRQASACLRFATRLQFGKGLVPRFAKGSGSPKVRANVVGARYSDKVCPSELVALSGSPIGIPAQKENARAGHQKCGRAVRQSGD